MSFEQALPVGQAIHRVAAYCFVDAKVPVLPLVGYATPFPSWSVWWTAADPLMVVPLRVPVNVMVKLPPELASDAVRFASLPVMFPVPLMSNGNAVHVVKAGANVLTMPMWAVVLAVPAAVPLDLSTTFKVSTPDAETLYWHPRPSVTVPSEAFQVPLRNVSDSSNVAVTVISLFMTRSHALLDATPPHAPPQAVKADPGFAVAVTVTLVPGT